MKPKKLPTGRPPKLSLEPEIMDKLESVLRLGVSDKMACEYANVSRDTYYKWLKIDKSFSDRMMTAKNYARIAAGQVVVQAIVKDKDVASARWWLEKKHSDEFKSKPDFVTENKTQINFFSNYEQLAEQLYRLSRHVVQGGHLEPNQDLNK
jgi:hypothetical protein